MCTFVSHGIKSFLAVVGVVMAVSAVGCSSGGGTSVGDTVSDADGISGGDASSEVTTDALPDGSGKPETWSDTQETTSDTDGSGEKDDSPADVPDAELTDAEPSDGDTGIDGETQIDSDTGFDAEGPGLECVPACDDSEHRTCDGATGTCVCQPDYCDVEGECIADGTIGDTGCVVCDVANDPLNWTVRAAAELCRASAGGCDPAELCDGTSEECPADSYATSGPCDDGDACTADDQCHVDKSCSGTAYECVAPGYCETAAGAVCDGTGGCVYLADVGAACDDETDCTREDKCDGAKQCVGTPFECAPGECHASSVCDGDGCLVVNKENGASCGDDDQCLDGECIDCLDLTGCADLTEDGSTCTDVACVEGHCIEVPNDSNLCDDGIDCTIDSCSFGECVVIGTSSGCFINSECVAEGAVAAPLGDAGCLVCAPSTSWDQWTVGVGLGCDDVDLCTFDDQCSADGQCIGTVHSCGEFGECNGTNICTCEYGIGGDNCDECAQGWAGTIPYCTPCDVDQDGYAAAGGVCNGSDCDDLRTDVNPGAVDLPDAEFLDADCDAYDGSLSNAILVSLAGDDAGLCGAITAPCRTVTRGLARAAEDHKTQLWLQAGEYNEVVWLSAAHSGIGIYGGYDTSWHRGDGSINESGSPYRTLIWNGWSAIDGEYVTARAEKAEGVTFGGLMLQVTNASGVIPGTRNGRSCYVFQAVDSELAFENVAFYQGNAVDGSAGTDGTDYSTPGDNGEPGLSTTYFGTCYWNGPNGGLGGSGNTPGGDGHVGGAGGGVRCDWTGIGHVRQAGFPSDWSEMCGHDEAYDPYFCCGDGNLEAGYDGCLTSDGAWGQGGDGGDGGSLSASWWWTGAAGSDGALGAQGSGGGGGGGGGSIAWGLGTMSGGSGGGGGEGGGRSETAGTGGGAGGSSFGLLAINSVVRLAECEFHAGKGGKGGNGGKGGLGSAGGAGGAGGCWDNPDIHCGGDGLAGGRGGPSGGGGGGSGGLSVGVYGKGSLMGTNPIQFLGGAAGTGGTGGVRSETSPGSNGSNGSLETIILL